MRKLALATEDMLLFEEALAAMTVERHFDEIVRHVKSLPGIDAWNRNRRLKAIAIHAPADAVFLAAIEGFSDYEVGKISCAAEDNLLHLVLELGDVEKTQRLSPAVRDRRQRLLMDRIAGVNSLRVLATKLAPPLALTALSRIPDTCCAAVVVGSPHQEVRRAAFARVPVGDLITVVCGPDEELRRAAFERLPQSDMVKAARWSATGDHALFNAAIDRIDDQQSLIELALDTGSTTVLRRIQDLALFAREVVRATHGRETGLTYPHSSVSSRSDVQRRLLELFGEAVARMDWDEVSRVLDELLPEAKRARQLLDIAGLLEHLPAAKIKPAWLRFFPWEGPAKPVLVRLAEGGWEIDRKDESAPCTRCEGQGGGFNFAGDSWQCSCHSGVITDVTILGRRGSETFRKRWLWDGEAWQNRYDGEACPPSFTLPKYSKKDV